MKEIQLIKFIEYDSSPIKKKLILVGIGDSIKSSDKLELPFTIGSLIGKSASLEKNNVIKVDHTKFFVEKLKEK